MRVGFVGKLRKHSAVLAQKIRNGLTYSTKIAVVGTITPDTSTLVLSTNQRVARTFVAKVTKQPEGYAIH